MELSGNESRVRLAAATVFFGADLLHVGSISDRELEEISRTLFAWSGILRRNGVSSFSSRLRQDKSILSRIISGSGGERRETDYVHIIELLHAETGGKGCSPEDVLAAFTRLSALDDMSETVSRRIESDRDAVQIMTVHASKGLEFPIVVVADLWKMERKGGKPPVPVFHYTSSGEDGLKERMIDVGWVVNQPFVLGKNIMDSEEGAEKKRLFYVAMTRAEHHVSLIYASKGPNDKVARVTDGLLEDIANSPDSSSIEVRMMRSGAGLGKYQHNFDLVSDLSTAELSNSVTQTYQRQSFSGLTKNHRGEQQLSVDSQEASRGGDGDDDQIITVRTGYAAEDVPETLGNIPMPLARLTGGTYFGKVLHRVYELLDFSAEDLRSEVQRVVDAVVVGALSSEREKLIEGIALSLETPLDGVVGDISLTDIGPKDRLAELNFEMRTAELAHEVKVSDIGRVLTKSLLSAGRSDDILLPYAKNLEENFSSQIVGLMNGSIDALLRIHGESGSRYFITDYKSNRIDSDGDDLVISGYTRERMMEEMAHHDYPLQALIYGVGVYRYLRWCQPDVDADQSVAGFCYLFIRAMIGQQTPVADSHRHGVFTWEAPPGLWTELSLLFSGVKS
jgi:exodeoxyribonuclease V beta subunit